MQTRNGILASLLFLLAAGCGETARLGANEDPAPPIADAPNAAAIQSAVVNGNELAPGSAKADCPQCKQCKEGDCPRDLDAPSTARETVDDRGIVLGDTRGEHTLVVFTDMQCPFCAKHHKQLEAFVASHPKGYRIVIRHNPLPFHDHAVELARASIAADRLDKGAPFVAALFPAARANAATAIDVAAREAGLDAVALKREAATNSVGSQLATDQADAERLNVKGTPTSFVDGRRMVGARPNLDAFVSANQK